MKATVVLVHAHPDDETLLTGGTIARLSAEGHRVVVVTATDGGSGLTGTSELGDRRLDQVRADELERACALLGVQRLVRLGHPDSGRHDEGPPDRFSALPIVDVAQEIAGVLRAELPDAVTVYDPAGGYGHPDHRQVHRAGMLAAQLVGTPLILQATVDRRALSRALRTIGWVPGLPDGFRASAVADRFVAHDRLTHRVDVREHIGAKRAAMAAHRSQHSADSGDRTLAWALRLPRPVFDAVFGHEWFVEIGRPPSRPLLDDPLSRFRLRPDSAAACPRGSYS